MRDWEVALPPLPTPEVDESPVGPKLPEGCDAGGGSAGPPPLLLPPAPAVLAAPPPPPPPMLPRPVSALRPANDRHAHVGVALSVKSKERALIERALSTDASLRSPPVASRSSAEPVPPAGESSAAKRRGATSTRQINAGGSS